MNTELAIATIDAFGGTTALARLIKSPTSTVHSWKSIGIPASRMAHLQLLARAEGITLPSDAAPSNDTADVEARTVLCATCERRTDDLTTRSCTFIDCPHSQREAA